MALLFGAKPFDLMHRNTLLPSAGIVPAGNEIPKSSAAEIVSAQRLAARYWAVEPI
jgi:hypothetical protein